MQVGYRIGQLAFLHVREQAKVTQEVSSDNGLLHVSNEEYSWE